MTPEQQRLLDKASRSLQAARELNNTGFPEFATSRAYYSMFYIATAFLEAEGLSYSRHSAVIAAFGERFARTNRVPVELHRYLIDISNNSNPFPRLVSGVEPLKGLNSRNQRF
uniref:HEPN domain-containing protein n=1 Tax=Microcoleus asticus TaxID=2815231 RepID=UPI0015582397